ncbi:MAG: AAA family ATPase [Dehalococcoidia bacterium]
MIPSKLKLNNFMSYRGETDILDFDDWSVACITGDNGNGKSAILEAITWVLWGKTRVQRSKDLISKGEEGMFAEFEFNIDYLTIDSLANTKYRILRSIKSKGSQRLNFEKFNGSDFTSISGNTVSETQSIIEKIVNMNYETFVNTSYLMQGNADRFSTSQPTKRKEILSEILNLNQWQKLSDFSRKKLNDSQRQTGLNNMMNDRTSTELLELDPDQKGIEYYKNEFDDIEKNLNIKQKIKTENQSKLNNLNNLKNNLKREEDKKSLLERQLLSKKEDIELVSQHIHNDKLLITKSDEIKSEYEKISNDYDELNILTKSFVKYQELNSDMDRYKISLQSLEQTFELELKNNNSKLIELKDNLNSEKSTYIINQNEITKLEAEKTESHENYNKSDESIKNQDSEIQLLNNEILKNNNYTQDLRTKIDLLNSDTKTCPICDSEIDGISRNKLISDYKAEISKCESQVINWNNELKKLISLREKNHNLFQESNKQIINCENKISFLDSENIKIKKSGEFHSDQIAELVDIIENLKNYKDTDQKYKEVYAQEKKIQKEFLALNFDLDRYNYLNSSVIELKTELEKEKIYLEQAEIRISENNNKLKFSELEKINIETEIKTINDSINFTNSEMESYDVDINIIESLEAEINDLVSQKHAKLSFIDNLESKIKSMDQIKSKNKHLFNQQENLEILVKSFGTNGIPAQIIEYSLPELSRETNKLLSSLTENSLTVEFRKVDGKKISGSESRSQEIEIFIGDHDGVIRDYETYSGGESFRIDFAIRIALSRLISLRSGVRSPILFIDEGFGSQDHEGQDRLREAIQTVSISDDYKFKKIIVITHLETLKESFDRAVEVVKKNGVSSFTLN